MKLIASVLLAALLFALPARADQIIDYTETVVNAGIGDFSWTIANDGFIPDIPPPSTYDSQGDCVANCNPSFFHDFVSVSAPSNGGGCGITGVYLYPDYGPAPVTVFSPLCDGMYDAFEGGGLPDVGTLGTWSWTGTKPDGTLDYVTLTISDASVPEPSSLALLALGLSVFIPLKLRRLRYRDRRLKGVRVNC
jgi:hypothetical protein